MLLSVFKILIADLTESQTPAPFVSLEAIRALTPDKTAADPIADVLTELRLKLGSVFFVEHLLPYLEE